MQPVGGARRGSHSAALKNLATLMPSPFSFPLVLMPVSFLLTGSIFVAALSGPSGVAPPNFLPNFSFFAASWAPPDDLPQRYPTWTEALLIYLSLARDEAHTLGDSTLPQAVYLFKFFRSNFFTEPFSPLMKRPLFDGLIIFLKILSSVLRNYLSCSVELLAVLLRLQAQATAEPHHSTSYIHVKCFDLKCHGSSFVSVHDFICSSWQET